MLKRYVLAGLMMVFAGSAFAEINAGRAYIPCVAGAYNCTPGLAPVQGGPRPGVGVPPAGIARPLPAPGGPVAPGIARPLPAPGGPVAPGMARPLPAPGRPVGGAGVAIGVNVGVHAGAPAMAPMPCPPRPCAPPPQAGVRVSVRVNVRIGGGCGMVRGCFKMRGGCFGGRKRCC